MNGTDRPVWRRSGLSRLELASAAVVAAVLAVVVLAEPDVLEAPFENGRTLAFTGGGTVLAAVALVLMVRHGVPPLVRVAVLLVPFLAVSWWLISPFFLDEVVHDEFDTSIAAAQEVERGSPEPPAYAPPSTAPGTTPPSEPAPRLRGAGSFVGLAGHEGTGDAGFFELPGGEMVLRLERFDIENGPDLRLYVVPGGGQTSLAPGAVDLGRLRGNVGDQTYELPADLALTPGDWTVLVWCEAFSVEFVAATVTVA